MTRVALTVLHGRGFALAGSGAIREHGIVDRPTRDVDSIRASGRLTDAQLIAAAAERDGGFDTGMFASQLEQVTRLRPAMVERYGVNPDQLAASNHV
jgi:hypothetical protein